MAEEGEKSKAFLKFEAYFFGEDDISKPMFYMIDPHVIDRLSVEEKSIAEEMVVAALSERYDRRWLYALEELKTETAYQFLMDWFIREFDEFIKIKLAYSLVRIDGRAPVLDYLQEALKSDASQDLKENALACFFWIREVGLESRDKQQLFLSMLFGAMSDSHQGVRLYAYDLLRDYYDMKDFTPRNDEVLNILLENHKEGEYRRAIDLFEKRIQSSEPRPIRKQLIVKHIRDLPDNPPSLSVTECEICSTIPNNLHADMAAGESLDVYKSKLERVIVFAYYSNCIMRCPTCGRLYKYKYEYEFLVGWSSEEDEYLARTDTKGAIEMVASFLKYYDFKWVTTCGIFLKTSY